MINNIQYVSNNNDFNCVGLKNTLGDYLCEENQVTISK